MKPLKFTFSAMLILLGHFTFAQTGSWKLAGNSLAGTEKLGSKNNFPINFITNNTQKMTLTTAGNLGIGVTAPKGKLHVFSGSSGVTTPASSSTLVVESNFTNFISLLNPANNTSGILFANNLGSEDGSITYNDGLAQRGLVFRTASTPYMALTSIGNLGIGTMNAASELHILHGDGNTHGLRLQSNTAGGSSWTIFQFGSTDGDLGLAASGTNKGFFDKISGAYSTISDLRAKKDVEQSPDVLEKVMELQVKKYHFLANKTSDKKHYGMIAQEVEKTFPEIVSHKVSKDQDFYAVDYSAYGVIAIKAIQEQQKTIEKLQAEVEDLKKRVEASSSSSQSSDNVAKTNVSLSAAHLSQNAPNPFNSNTVINYYLPEIKGSASIEIISSNGQLIKTYPLTQKGNGQLAIKAGELSTGTYHYVLKIDGAKVDSKQMMIMKNGL